MSFNIFGNPTKDDIRVAYISTERGMVNNVTVCEANDYAKLNPGTQFIFRTKDITRYMNINGVNKLTPDDLASKDECEGIQMDKDCGPPRVIVSGGGGAGIQANPIIGQDGSVMAVDIITGGFGYELPPTIEVKDNCGIGAGGKFVAQLGEIVDQVEYYDTEDDFEEYEICETASSTNRRFDIDGNDLGEWEPKLYANFDKDPIAREIQKYQEVLGRGTNPYWTTRTSAPLFVTGDRSITKRVYNVGIATAWGEFMNEYAISPKPTSNVEGSDFAGVPYSFVWEVNFNYDGEYVFRGAAAGKAELYLDDELISSLDNPFGSVNAIKKTVKEGIRKVRVDLQNFSDKIPVGPIGLVNGEPYSGPFHIHQRRDGTVVRMVGAQHVDTPHDIISNPPVGISTISWNQNPMGISVSIDAPEPPVPQEEIPEAPGRCPRNPMWSTRFPGGDTKWFPVRFGEDWSPFFSRYGLSPISPRGDKDVDDSGKVYSNTWKVDIPYNGFYKLVAAADDIGRVYLDDELKIELSAKNNRIEGEEKFFLSKGTSTIRVEVENYKSDIETWTENPIGISAILIPPPCPRRVSGKGVVTQIVVQDPGNGFPVSKGDGYPVGLALTAINVLDSGINYDCSIDKVVIKPSNGASASLRCDNFGRVNQVVVDNPGLGFTKWPSITIPSRTGVNFEATPVFEVIRDPIVIDETKLIQVTDLVGLRLTGYYKGRPYYGQVFYKDNIKYAGYYETPGELVQIYDTLQQSIEAEK